MLAYLFLLIAVAVRFMPHPWMFTPVVGALLFFGSRVSRRFLWVALVVMAASDVALTKGVSAYPFVWGSLRTGGVVRGIPGAGHEPPSQRQAATRNWRSPGQFGFFFSDQQFS